MYVIKLQSNTLKDINRILMKITHKTQLKKTTGLKNPVKTCPDFLFRALSVEHPYCQDPVVSHPANHGAMKLRGDQSSAEDQAHYRKIEKYNYMVQYTVYSTIHKQTYNKLIAQGYMLRCPPTLSTIEI